MFCAPFPNSCLLKDNVSTPPRFTDPPIACSVTFSPGLFSPAFGRITPTFLIPFLSLPLPLAFLKHPFGSAGTSTTLVEVCAHQACLQRLFFIAATCLKTSLLQHVCKSQTVVLHLHHCTLNCNHYFNLQPFPVMFSSLNSSV